MVGRYGGNYTSHIRNRDAWLQDSIEEFLRIIREGGTKGEISHFNVRNRTGAAPGAWQRAVDTMRRRARSRASTSSPTRRRSGTGSARWPGSCRRGCSRTAGRRRASGCATRAVRERLRGECDRYWRFIHRGDWDRVRLQASPQYPGLEGKDFPEIAALLGTTSGTCYFHILADAGPGDREPAPDRRALHRRAPGGDDLAPALLARRRRLHGGARRRPRRGPGHPVCFAGHVHYLTHHVRELGTLPLEEAVRKMTSMPAQHFGFADRGSSAPGLAADLVVIDLDRLADGSTVEHPLAYVEGVDEVLVNGVAVVAGGEHTGARPGPAPAAGVIDLRSDFCAPPTEEMWEAMRSARLGWAVAGEDENVNELERRGAELLGKEAAVFVPTCTLANLAALLTLGRRARGRGRARARAGDRARDRRNEGRLGSKRDRAARPARSTRRRDRRT